MNTAKMTLHDIQTAQEHISRSERSLVLSQNELVANGFPPLRDEDISDELWLGCVALFITEEGFPGDTIVERNQDAMLAARAAGFAVEDIAQFAVLKTRELSN